MKRRSDARSAAAHHPRRAGRRAVVGALTVALTLGMAATPAHRHAVASSGDGVLEPTGRGLQVLGGREAILLEQSERARRVARSRALALYRLLRVAGLDRRGAGAGTAAGASATSGASGVIPASSADPVRGRSVALATAVLARDLEEARALRAELDRVRAERASLRASAPGHEAPTDGAPAVLPAAVPSFLRPVSGALVTPFGVGRDAGSGAWIFRAAASFASGPGEIVRSPADGRIARVADSVAGGAAVVVSHGAPAAERDAAWTLVLSGLASVAVAPGELVRRGDALGTAPRAPGSTLRIETWRDRSPVDPAGVLRAR